MGKRPGTGERREFRELTQIGNGIWPRKNTENAEEKWFTPAKCGRRICERELGKIICVDGENGYLHEIRLSYSQFCGMLVFIVARRQNAGDCRAGMSEDETNHGHQNNFSCRAGAWFVGGRGVRAAEFACQRDF